MDREAEVSEGEDEGHSTKPMKKKKSRIHDSSEEEEDEEG